MKLTKAKLQKLIKEEIEGLGGAGGPGMGTGDPEFSSKYDLEAGQGRAKNLKDTIDIMLNGFIEITEVTDDNDVLTNIRRLMSEAFREIEAATDDNAVHAIIQRASTDYETDEDDY